MTTVCFFTRFLQRVVAELLAAAFGQHLDGRPDQHDQEDEPQRGDDQDVREPRGLGDRRDVAVAGRGQRDGRVVQGVEPGVDLPVEVAVVRALEVDDRRGDHHAQHGDRGRGCRSPEPARRSFAGSARRGFSLRHKAAPYARGQQATGRTTGSTAAADDSPAVSCPGRSRSARNASNWAPSSSAVGSGADWASSPRPVAETKASYCCSSARTISATSSFSATCLASCSPDRGRRLVQTGGRQQQAGGVGGGLDQRAGRLRVVRAGDVVRDVGGEADGSRGPSCRTGTPAARPRARAPGSSGAEPVLLLGQQALAGGVARHPGRPGVRHAHRDRHQADREPDREPVHHLADGRDEPFPLAVRLRPGEQQERGAVGRRSAGARRSSGSW